MLTKTRALEYLASGVNSFYNLKSAVRGRMTKDNLIDYTASVTAALGFYIPLFAPMEYIRGEMTPLEIVTSRITAAGAQLVVAHPYQLARRKLAKALKVDNNSSKAAKLVVDELSTMIVQPPTYFGILKFSNWVNGHEMSSERCKEMLILGLAVALLTTPIFAPFSDFWRSYVFKRKSPFDKDG